MESRKGRVRRELNVENMRVLADKQAVEHWGIKKETV